MKKRFLKIFFLSFSLLFAWTTPERLTYLGNNTELSGNGARNIAIDQAGRIHIVFTSEALVAGLNYVPQVWYKRYEPNIGWTKDTCLADLPNEASEMPALALDSSNNLHLVYVSYTPSLSYSLRYKRWNPTTGWTISSVISTNNREKKFPAIAATPNGNLHCVWVELNPDGWDEIFYRERIGGDWPSPPLQISISNETDKDLPSVAGGRNNNLYVVWQGENPTTYYYNIYYRTRSGNNWGSVLGVCTFNSDQCDEEPYGPSIAIDTANVAHITWYGWNRWDEYFYRVFYRRRHPSSGWLGIDTIAGANQPDDFDRFAPQVLVDQQQNVRVVWFGEDYWTDGYYRLWHKKRHPTIGWLATEELAAEYPEGDLYNPHLANDGLGLHLIWFDDRLEDEEIFWMVSYPQDVEIRAIVSPPTFCTLASYQPKAIIRNSGENDILTPFDVRLTINPGSYENTVNVPFLSAGEEETLYFANWNPTAANLYLVKCTLLLADMFPLNNKKTIYSGIPSFLERFETSNGGFVSEPATNAWEWGTPSGANAPTPHSGTKCFGTNIDGNYANSANWKLNSIWYSATQDTPTLGFYHWYRFQTNYDGGNVKFSRDGVNFSILSPLEPKGYDRKLGVENAGIPNESAYSRGAFNPIGWQAVLMRIPVLAGDTFTIRWHFGSNNTYTYLGWYLDDCGGIGFEPRKHDVGIIEISSPPDIVDSSITYNPAVRLKNFGNRTENFSATMKIGSWLETKGVLLTPRQESTITFGPWTPIGRGPSSARCSLYLQSDENKSNDTLTKNFFVRVKDVGVLDIVSSKAKVKIQNPNSEIPDRLLSLNFPNPQSLTSVPDTIDSGDVYLPQARVKNFGNTDVRFWTRFSFGHFSSESLYTHLSPDQETLLTFNPFSVQARGIVIKKCSTLLAGDLVLENDAKEETTFVRVRDIGVVRFRSPSPPFLPGEITPEVVFRNYGNVTGSFSAGLKIQDSLNNLIYTDETTDIRLNPSDSISLRFQNWLAPLGRFLIYCGLTYSGDRVPSNDTLSLQITISTPLGWMRKADLSPTRKNVKSGGCLTALDSSVYALVGNNTRDFLRYSILRNSWQKLESLPFGPKGKKVKKGACLTNDGRYIYALKGGGTNEFYRYDPETNQWESLSPPNFTKGVRGGFVTYLEKDGGRYLYLGSGANNSEWKVYDINAERWEELPITLPREKFKIGSGLAYDSFRSLYLTQGGSKYNAFFRLDLYAPVLIWESLPNLPLIGNSARKKKIKEGAALVYSLANRKLYATKGGNTIEFWRFDPQTDSWRQMEDVGSPQMPAKKVKGGGSLAYSSFAGGIFATIGNNTNEFWFYGIGKDATLKVLDPIFSDDRAKSPFLFNSGQMDTSSVIAKEEEKVVIRVYNLLGELLGTTQGKKGLPSLKNLPSGIYILKLESGRERRTKKVIITR